MVQVGYRCEKCHFWYATEKAAQDCESLDQDNTDKGKNVAVWVLRKVL